MTNQRYLALIRGINVGRAKRVAMADLRVLVAELGFSEVRSVLNSGNIVFASPSCDPVTAAAALEERMVLKLGVSARVFVLDCAVLAAILAENTLLDLATNHSRLFVFLLPDALTREAVLPLCERDWGAEALAVGRHAAYVWCPEGILESAAATALGKQLGDNTTSRNWATMCKLYAMCTEAPAAAPAP